MQQFAYVLRIACESKGFFLFYKDKKGRTWVEMKELGGLKTFIALHGDLVDCGEIWLFRLALTSDNKIYDLVKKQIVEKFEYE